MERRYIEQPIELLEERDGEAAALSGYAAVYYDGTEETEFRLKFDGKIEFIERIMPGAFDAVMSKRNMDILGLFNHDRNMILGRRSAKTLQIKVDQRGLHYRIKPSEVRVYQDVLSYVKRGDVSGSSFGFNVSDQEFKRENNIDIREIRGFSEIRDVGPVAEPAFAGTSVSARDGDNAVKEWTEWKNHIRRASEDRLRRLRLAEAMR